MNKIILFFLMFSISAVTSAQKFTVSGQVTDSRNGEDIIGTTVIVKNAGLGTVTNEYGFYSLTIAEGTYTLIFQFTGYKDQIKEVTLEKNTVLNISLDQDVETLDEAVVTAKSKIEKVENKEISVVSLDIKTIKDIPVVFGEVDVLKTITFLPGIQSLGEGNSGISVRGGGQDQNLILLDEATVYNAAHLLGFFSVFNGDAIKDLEVYKGGIPAKYGGRLSSLIDIRMKDGNNKRFSGTGGLGTISSRLTLEGPIVKDRSSFMVAGRRSYIDLFRPLSKNEDIKSSRLYFYDLNLKANYDLDDKNRIYLSGYFGRDVFGFSELFSLNWGNSTATLRWNHLFSQKFFSNLSLIYSDFNYGIEFKFAENANFGSYQGISNWSAKEDMSYYFSPKSRLGFGGQFTLFNFEPGRFEALNAETQATVGGAELILPTKNALESALYVEHKYEFSERFNVRYGVRLSVFNNIGKAREFAYVYSEDNVPTPTDTFQYRSGEVYNTYIGPEPRLALSYNLNSSSAIKASYNRTFQYIQQASNAATTLPVDQWISAGVNIKPQRADQIAGGYFRNFEKLGLETSVEVYYKWMNNQLDYRNGAALYFNEQLDGELLFGKAWSYGSEFFIKRVTGKTTGFISYTLSKTKRQIKGINNGEPYFDNNDRRHSLSIVMTHNFNDRLTLSGTFVLATGRPLTVPVARHMYNGKITPIYGDRNNDRIPSYHRSDIGLTLNNKKKEGKNFRSSWNFSIYNFYARENPYIVNFEQVKEEDPVTGEDIVVDNQTQAVQIALFKIIPAITWNFTF